MECVPNFIPLQGCLCLFMRGMVACSGTEVWIRVRARVIVVKEC